MSKIVVVYYSRQGHTHRLAQAVAKGVASFEASVTLLAVGREKPVDWGLLASANGIIFGSPTFVGSMAGEFKCFLDQTAKQGFWTEKKLVNKMAAAFTVATYPSGDKFNTLMQLFVYAAQHGMIWVGSDELGSHVTADSQGINQDGSWLGLMATSIADKSRLIADSDLLTAERFGARFAYCVSKWAG
jgi:NAD(P)H dehydrogenase (quinone)